MILLLDLFLRTFLLLFVTQAAMGQSIAPKNYPQQYFRWPVSVKTGLVANFGELRSNHYHMGLDVRTDQRVNVPVFAAADGYIARVKIEPFGFGRCLYINHPNGYTTLYAHLNDFSPELEKYVEEQQYQLQSWKVFLDIPANLFPVKKSQFIAYSGSTGGSQGPHVHFEIRETATDKVLNPTLFGFPIPDNVPPVVIRLAVYDRNVSTYDQKPRLFPLRKVNGVYQPVGGKISVNSDKVSFAISAVDRVSGSPNPNGIYSAALRADGVEKCSFELDRISYDETRYMNAHIDYRTKNTGGPYLQHLSRLPGYPKGVYQSLDGSDGVVSLNDDEIHEIRIDVKDAEGNFTKVAFDVAKNSNVPVVRPTSLDLFQPLQVNVFERDDISFYLPEHALYDSFHFQYNSFGSGPGKTHQLHQTTVPVHDYFPISIKADFATEDTARVIMKRSFGTKEDYKKANYVGGFYKAWFRELGNFQLILDKTAPTVTAVGFRDGMNARGLKRIAFIVTDDSEEIEEFTALLDGKWLRFTNDKGKVFVYVFDEKCSLGQHELRIVAEDLAGNRTEKTYRFTR